MLRFARVDWERLRSGEKREVRFAGVVGPFKPNVPAAGWCRPEWGEVKRGMFLIEDSHTEPLGAISAESLEREGFATLDDFIAYWRGRYGTFRPLDRVLVIQLRPWLPGDLEEQGRRIMEHLYSGYLPE